MPYAGAPVGAALQIEIPAGAHAGGLEHPTVSVLVPHVSPPKYFSFAMLPRPSFVRLTRTSLALWVIPLTSAASASSRRLAFRKPLLSKQLSLFEVWPFSFAHWSPKVLRIHFVALEKAKAPPILPLESIPALKPV